ncbi:MAG: hypothetical protein SAK29_21800 [Scytonema sp. PMC 1069.18]|nr:hypothetical protein [Scytonema sp. PMC 1069.18]MEC4880952.1 hypothetical protein [Scytonema sp. PMC 1070.18]
MRSIYWLRTVQFQDNSIKLLDIETGIEFLAEDILMLVCPTGIDFGVRSLVEILPLKLRRKRHVYSKNNSNLQEVDTLCWLALKYVFNLFGYEKHREFVRWLRKDIAPSSHLKEKANNHISQVSTIQSNTHSTKIVPVHHVNLATDRLAVSELIVTKLNSLHWFNIITNSQLLPLSEMYLKSRFSLIGAPPTLVPAIQDYHQRDESLSLGILEAVYLSFLYKGVGIPSLSNADANLSNQLLRKRYLDCCQLVLENVNISYFDLYFTFVTDADNLFLAQELDIALVFSYLKKRLPFPILRVLEGGVFLQALDLCGLTGSLDNQLASSLKVSYLNWLSTLLSEII